MSDSLSTRPPAPARKGYATPRLVMYGRVEQKKAEWFGLYPQITPPWVETFLQDWAYSPEKAKRELGYTVTPLKEGLRQTYDWILRRRIKKQ